MKYQIIALDLDGTLLNDKKEVSEENLKALERCCALGIQIVPTTGRSLWGIPEIVSSLPGVTYCITTNGGSVVNSVTKRQLLNCTIANERALEIMAIAHEYDVMCDPYIEGGGVTQKGNFARMDHFHLSSELQVMVRNTRTEVPDMLEYVKENGAPVQKINIFFADLAEREELRKRLDAMDDVVVTSSLWNNLEINHANATKGNALLWLADYLGVPHEATMAFGDGENDVSMLRMAGMGIAMGNASDAIKSCAKRVTLTNEENGVAAAIKELVLGEVRV